ncbi:anterior gradient protein 2 homolog [Terrapene carolina triunguis]|uniref:anterior gradient protein 2 homolog n=1 Tax=Terrapene triunguis TaxID=2587831 RepID=UPI000E7759CB|nr:anterior gradient protein 2 homolog [Terrapene carolina triunguis]
MHSFQLLCSLLLCNALVVAAQRKLQKVPEQEENITRIRMPQTLSRDPSMTVRADLTGKYKNRMYAYEPEDISNLIENMRRAKTLLHTEL